MFKTRLTRIRYYVDVLGISLYVPPLYTVIHGPFPVLRVRCAYVGFINH